MRRLSLNYGMSLAADMVRHTADEGIGSLTSHHLIHRLFVKYKNAPQGIYNLYRR